MIFFIKKEKNGIVNCIYIKNRLGDYDRFLRSSCSVESDNVFTS